MGQFRANGCSGQSVNGHAAQNEGTQGEVVDRPRATGYRMKPGAGPRFAKYAGEQFENPTEIVLQKLEAQGCQPLAKGADLWESLCPVHASDGLHHERNLQIAVGQDGDCVVHCFAHQCDRRQIAEALGLQEFHLFRPRPESRNGQANGKPKPDRTHVYQDQHGDAVYQSRRRNGSWFQERYDVAEGKFVSGGGCMKGVPLFPFMLPDLLQWLQDKPGEIVYIAEGEKDVETLWGLKMAATCNVGGADKWRDEYTEWFKGRKVVIFQDNDEPGRRHAQKVAGSCHKAGCQVRVLGMPEPHKDVADFIAAGGTRAELVKWIKEAPDWTPSVEPETKEPETSSKERLEDLGIFDMDEDEIENVDWIEEDVIGTGGITIIAGEGGLGKSQIAMSFAATISNGDRFPCSDHDTDRGYVLVMSSEDKKKSVIMPRLKAAGADLSMVKEYKCYEKVTDEKGKKTLVRRSLQDYEWFDRVLAERSDTRLVIMDSIKSFLGPGVNENSELDVRNVLEPISKILEERNVALLGISHTNKGGNDTSANNLLSGTQAYRNIVRCLFYTFMDNEEEGRLFLAANKNNEGALHKTFVYRITPTTVKKRNSELVVKTSRVDWEDELSDLTCNDCLARHRDRSRGVKRRHVKKEEVIAFLRQIVNEGPIRSKDLDAKALQAGYTINHVIDNVREAGIRAKKIGDEWWKYVGEWTGTREYAREDGNAVPY